MLALRDGILDPNDWNFYFVGKDLAPIKLNGNLAPALLQNIKWTQYQTLVSSMDLVHRLISRRHTVGFKRVWMLGASEERICCDT